MYHTFVSRYSWLGVTCLIVICTFSTLSEASLVRKNPSKQPYQFVQIPGIDESSSSHSHPSHNLRKRDTTTAAAISNVTASKIKTSAVNLNDSHNQLLVFWAGEDVVLCLAKDVNSNGSSTLHISLDYGGNFTNATSSLIESLTQKGGSSVVQPQLEGFFNHPSYNGHFAFSDIKNQYIFTTRNYGKNFNATKLDFIPDEVLFDPHSDNNIVAYEKSTTQKQMWVSDDYGLTWIKVQDHVKSLAWDESFMPAKLYLQREEPGPGERSVIISSDSLFLEETSTAVVISGVEEFEVKDEFMFATKQKDNATYDLYIAYKNSEFKKAIFPSSQQTKHFFIADVSTDGQIFVCVVQNQSVSNLYIGTFPLGPEESPKFSLSLERILYFKPNVTWSDSWLNEVGADPFVDLHHVEGLRGVYIASQLKPTTVGSGTFNINEVISLITYDQGGEWQVLNPPEFEHDGRPIYCQYKSGSNCSLHVSQRLSELYPRTRAVPILSKKSAVGLVLATGTVNYTLKGHLGVFLSTDGAVTWRQILQGNYFYAFGDHGGIIVATKMYKIGDDTNELIYSIDEGETWEKYQFYKEKVRIMGLMTEPGENTTVFFIFGSVAKSEGNTTRHTWVLLKVDFRDVFERNCQKEDYKEWSPWDSKPGRPCLLGRKEFYERRIPTRKCYNGQTYVRAISNKTCICSRVDFECDFGYVEDTKIDACVKDTSETSPGVKPEWCKPMEQYYNKTKGYRKVPGDICIEGNWVNNYLPETIPCEVKEEPEFVLVAKRDAVLRIDLNHLERVETLPLTRVAAVIGVDFNMKNNCIFWSDVTHKAIMRLHLDGISPPEVLVSTELFSVEGLAFDWLANNLYFTDGSGSKIEVIKTDAVFHRRMRKRLLTKPDVEKPRGIVVHPQKGYLFWTDWSNQNPSISRSHLDGSNVKRIVQNADQGGTNNLPVAIKWPNGITVDYNQNRIYWVDANLDWMLSADLDGNNLKIVLEKDSRVSHPFSVAVYKNSIFWDDWTTRGIYSAPLGKEGIGSPDTITQIQTGLPRLMDLKVYGVGMQQGTNLCVNSTCSHLCMMNPNGTMHCMCPDGFVKQNETCVCPDGKQPSATGACESKCEDGKTFACKAHPEYCIINAWRCDGENDCADGSDEEGCITAPCSDPNEFKCKVSGRCIPRSFLCDYDNDCGPDDTSDETEHCEVQNSCDLQKNFKCANNRCIMKSWVCDDDDDCLDGSDEKNCTNYHNHPNTTSCLPNEFKCPNETKCISSDWVCDFDHDCDGGGDEKNCTAKNCPDWKFGCASGHCIMKTWECDGDTDCPDGSDEHKNCPPSTSPTTPVNPFQSGNCSAMSQMFECLGSKECVPVYWKCDGIKDCQDGSDELGCKNDDEDGPTVATLSPAISHCPMDNWRCDNGQCIPSYYVCNGFKDCVGGDDEKDCHNTTSGECPKNMKRCGDSRVCVLPAKWCDDVFDCPNKADELECKVAEIKTNCNPGGFACNDNTCVGLSKRCNGKNECPNGEDDDQSFCSSKPAPVYQVDGIQTSESDSTWFGVDWWMDHMPSSINLMFIPSICEVESRHCWNATKTSDRTHKFGVEPDNDKLRPYTSYSVTVYVTDGKKDYPPFIYYNVTTEEDDASPPFGLQVKQNTTEDLIVTWKKPHTPNGKIKWYQVYFQPPLPTVAVKCEKEELVISNKQSNPAFLPGQNYSFWVTATNSHGEGKPSEVVHYVYNGDVSLLSNLKVNAAEENSAKLSWETANKNVDSYVLILETDEANSMYKFRTTNVTTVKSIEYEKLASGTPYKFSVTPKYKGIHGKRIDINFVTKGKPLPRVEGLKGALGSNGKVKLSWTAAKVNGAKYGIYYGKTTQEMTERRASIQTSMLEAEVDKLDPCVPYLFAVGVITPSSYGSPSNYVQVLTKMDPLSPPRSVEVKPVEGLTSILVSWKAPCDVMEKKLGYNITIIELTHNSTYAVSNVSYSISPHLSHQLEFQYGGRYQLTVSSNVIGAKSSPPAVFDGPSIPFPEKIQLCTQCTPVTLMWTKPNLPKLVTKKGSESYVVWLSKNKNFTDATKYETSETSLKLTGIEDSGLYYAAITVKDAEGLESPRSTPIIVQQAGDASAIVLSGSSALAITVTVVVIILLLVTVLGIFVVRHKRLQTSFLNFASSHYSSHSGAATFQQNVAEEHDSPVIRGFSDDEPLLVA